MIRLAVLFPHAPVPRYNDPGHHSDDAAKETRRHTGVTAHVLFLGSWIKESTSRPSAAEETNNQPQHSQTGCPCGHIDSTAGKMPDDLFPGLCWPPAHARFEVVPAIAGRLGGEISALAYRALNHGTLTRIWQSVG
jgi:hypothetical protein